MKNLIRISALALILAICISALAGCDTDFLDRLFPGEDSGEEPPVLTPDDNPEEAPEPDPDKIPGEENYDIITIAEALELCGEPGNITTERYYIKGKIKSVTNPEYGAMIIEDETGSIEVYGTYSSDGAVGYAEITDKPYKGDLVILHCILQNYNGTKEVKNARLIALKHIDAAADAGSYTEMSIADARDAAADAKIKTTGAVAAITYANGMKPQGVILVDSTSSIYVYDGDLAGRVRVGDVVTIQANKAYWVLDTEKTSAEKFGYKGCCQLEDVTLVSTNTVNYDHFDMSWITETTVKDILDTPVTENITSKIYKVNALVSKKEGTGFTNYYFYDLDGKTGAYTYTQCNGSDFSWIDDYDGKICTVYLMAINAKSSSTDCFFRLLPIKVKDEGFVFNTENTAEHAVKYYGIPQFANEYTGNPEIELITSVSSELLGFEGAALTYKSSNEDVVYFTESGGKLIFNCGEAGEAEITVKGEYGGKSYEKTVKITVKSNQTYDTVTVEEAIAKTVGETVIVKGIVGPSVVNKSAFYLFDGTGMIAVVVKDSAIFSEIEVGHEIVITAKRDKYKNTQTCLTDAEVLANYYGNHEYPTDKFITDKDLKYIYDLNSAEDHTTEAYVVKATVNLVEAQYYTKLTLKDGATELTLYCSGAGQYAFLKEFAGQEVTLEVAPCNWNEKNYYTGCVLAVRTNNGKIINTLNFK